VSSTVATGITFENNKKYTYGDSIRGIPREKSDFGELTRPRRSFLSHRFFFIHRCLPSKTHASHHYKIADYSRSRYGAAAGPFYPFRLDRLERGIENGSERSELRVRDRETPALERRGGRGSLIGGIRSSSSGANAADDERTRARARREEAT